MTRFAYSMVIILTAILFLQGGSCQQHQRTYKAPTTKEILTYLTKRAQHPLTMRGEARMWYRSPQGKIGVTVRMMFSRPDKLRFDAFSSVDSLLASLVANADKFAALDAKENHHYFGQASPCNVARFLRVALAPSDVIAILGGTPPLIAHQQAKLSWDATRGAEILTLEGFGLIQTIVLDGYNHYWDLLSTEIRNTQGDLILKIDAENFKPRNGGVRLPGKLRLMQPKQKTEIDLTFSEQEADLQLPAQAFDLPTADGLPSEELTCETAP